MITDLSAALIQTSKVELTEDEPELITADKVLVVLTEGVLSGRSLEQLELRLDKRSGDVRLVLICSEQASWDISSASTISPLFFFSQAG